MRKHAYDLFAITAIATSAAAFAVTAGAQTTPGMGTTDPGTSSEYTKLDKDKDGNVSKKEAASNKDLAKRFAELDSNKDGKLDQGEFAKFEAGPAPSESPSSNPIDRPPQ